MLPGGARGMDGDLTDEEEAKLAFKLAV